MTLLSPVPPRSPWCAAPSAAPPVPSSTWCPCGGSRGSFWRRDPRSRDPARSVEPAVAQMVPSGGESRHVRAFSKPYQPHHPGGVGTEEHPGPAAGPGAGASGGGGLRGVPHLRSGLHRRHRHGGIPVPGEPAPAGPEHPLGALAGGAGGGESLYREDQWTLDKPILPRPRLPLSDNLSRPCQLKEMKTIYGELPHIDCGSCGRPSCKAMAEDIVRGGGR